MKSDFLQQLGKDFPQSFPFIQENNLVREELISPFVVELPKKVLSEAQDFVGHVYQIKESEDYQQQLPKDVFNLEQTPDTPAVLSCFDFHYSPETGLKLIEINTNASLFLPFVLLQKIHGITDFPNAEEELFASFVQTYHHDFQRDPQSVVIIDKEPKEEGLYFEFLLFKEWFEQKGWTGHIQSLQEYSENPAGDFVYNRFTDFYFENQESSSLKQNYLQKKASISPNPREYFLMADKNRLSLLRSYPALQKNIPESKKFSDFASMEELWSQRKKYFFKPSQSFGSKAVYQGKSISKTHFNKIDAANYIAQELVPPGRIEREYQQEKIELKYDLRFYSYKGKVQNAGARLYRGQTTNMKTPLGGLAPIRFI